MNKSFPLFFDHNICSIGMLLKVLFLPLYLLDDEYNTENDRSDTFTLSKKELEEIEADSNMNFAIIGEKVIEESLKSFVRSALPSIPEEGVEEIKNYLSSDEMLSRVAYHIGTKDLILSKEYPPSRGTYAAVLKAIVGALSSR